MARIVDVIWKERYMKSKELNLTENFVDLIKTCQYQEITFYGKNGMLRDDVKYKDN